MATSKTNQTKANDKAKAEPKAKLGKVEITAPKGGDLLDVRQAEVAKAIKATKKSVQALGREHGLNPSQLRRMLNKDVARVDSKRAAAIADALGQPVEDLFTKPEPKAATKKAATKKAEPKAEPKADEPQADEPKAEAAPKRKAQPTARRTRKAARK